MVVYRTPPPADDGSVRAGPVRPAPVVAGELVVAYSDAPAEPPLDAQGDRLASPGRSGTIVIVTPPADRGDPGGLFMDL